MCGIVGVIGTDPTWVLESVRALGLKQAHRGPDAQGDSLHAFGATAVALGHQRLSILDLSNAGIQPMTSHSGRFTMVFNGEVYNYLELAKQHRLENLRSGSDSEVVLELIEKLGAEQACKQFNGMFAILAVDREAGRVHIARDRFGKKPLYHYRNGDTVVFASELKSFKALPGFRVKPNMKVAARYLSQALQDIDNETWFEGVSSFPPSCVAAIDLARVADGLIDLVRYWEPSALQTPTMATFEGYVEELRETVSDATRIRLRADVPAGVALSGGLDSSILSVLTSRRDSDFDSPVALFSAVNPGAQNDESPFIDRMAEHLGQPVQKVELGLDPSQDLRELMRKCTYFNDAPLGSFSNLLFYLLMEKAVALDVKVILTGQGADEAFCGYRKYPMLEIKRLLKQGRLLAATQFAAGFGLRGTLFPQFNFAEAKRYLGSANQSILGEACRAVGPAEALGAMTGSMAERQWLDVTKYSVPYLCHYEDRMSMAWSREVRAPFLDYRVVDMGLRAPTSFKLQSGWTKYCLRKAFEPDLPAEIVWRKDKQGFVNPQDDWLKGALKASVDAMIDDAASPVFALGMVDREAYGKVFASYCNGNKKIWFRDVFSPFALNIWLEEFGCQ